MADIYEDYELRSSDKDGRPPRVSELHQAGAMAPEERDAYVLARSGKKQVLKRRFGLFSMSSYAIAGMVSWEAVLQGLVIGLANGGPAGVLYGVIVVWAGMQSVNFAMGELASMMPTAGGQYHWATVLAPKPLRNLVGYITGVVTVMTWIAAATGNSYVTATILVELVAYMIPSYQSERYQATLIMWGVLFLAVFLNTALGALLPAIELIFVTLHVLGFFATLIPLVNLGSKGDAYELFTTFNNGGAWSSTALAFFVGLVGNASSILGTDGTVHMAEEVERAELNAPRALTVAVALNGTMSFVMAFVFLYVAGPLDALANYPGQYPLIQIIDTATGSKGATAALVGYMVVMSFGATVTATASGSRMVWAFARDRGLPFSGFISRVEKRHALPMVAIFTVVICASLLGLIQIGSTVAFNIILSVGTAGFFSSYLCCLLPLLYRRLAGHMSVIDTRSNFLPDDMDQASRARAPIAWGPWRASGVLGTLNNIFAICYLVVVGFFTFWPPTAQVTPASMNYSSVILGGVAILSALYYVLRARKTFKGPIVEVKAE